MKNLLLIFVSGQFRSDFNRWVFQRSDRYKEYLCLNPEDVRDWPTRWLFLSAFYSSFRWVIYWPEPLDYNADFNCVLCSKPVLRFQMYCSTACWKADTV